MHTNVFLFPKEKKMKKNYYDKIDNALREAAGRGVEIKIIFLTGL